MMNTFFCRILAVTMISGGLSLAVRADETLPVRIERDLVYAEVDGQQLTLDLYLPEGQKRAPMVVWIHGGGWRGGNKHNPPDQGNHEVRFCSCKYQLSVHEQGDLPGADQ
jgi:predicted peptidase